MFSSSHQIILFNRTDINIFYLNLIHYVVSVITIICLLRHMCVIVFPSLVYDTVDADTFNLKSFSDIRLINSIFLQNLSNNLRHECVMTITTTRMLQRILSISLKLLSLYCGINMFDI